MDTKEVNSLSSALLESLNTISKANTSTGTLTIEARIKEVVDEGLGIYQVEYMGNLFEANTSSENTIYNIDDIVYVLVPDGNFDKEKVILSHVNKNATIYATIEDENTFISLGDNLLTDTCSTELCSYKTQEKTINSNYLSNLLLLMNDSLQDSRFFNLFCEIKTAIPQDQRSRGNYGLELTLPVVQNEIETTYKVILDINTIQGDPYNFQIYANQNLSFELPENMELNLAGIPTLKSFCKDFVIQDNTKPNDIFIRNIQIIPMLNKADINMDGYYVYINASEGRSFYSGNYGSKILSPIVYYKGKKTKVENYQCYWFKENATIGYTHNKYHRYGGVGWEILNDINETAINSGGDNSIQYITNNYQYVIDGINFLTNTKYKCVLVKGETIIQNTATIRIISSPVELILTSDKKDNICIDNIGTVKLTMRYKDSRVYVNETVFNYVYWKRFDKYGNFIEDTSLSNSMVPLFIGNENGVNIYECSIEFPVSNIDIMNTIYCSVTNLIDNKEYLVGTRSLLLSTIASTNYTITVNNGDKLYKYDADGDSPLVSNYDGPISSANPVILPLNIRIFKPNGEEFSEAEYDVTTVEWLVPIEKNSMIVINSNLRGDTTSNPGYYTISGSYDSLSNLNYSIRNTFDRKRSNNTIIVKAYFKSNEVEITTNINFLKDGESGTNGTKYSAIVVYVENPTTGEAYAYEEKDINGVENKIQLIYAKDIDTWYRYNPAKGILIPLTRNNEIAKFEVEFYTDGVLDSNRTVEWSIIDDKVNYGNILSPLKVVKSGGNTIIKLSENSEWVDSNFIYSAVLQAKVIKNDEKGSSLTNSNEAVYAYYPIETTYVEKIDYLKDMLPRLHGGYTQVIYSNDGTNPKFDTTNPFEIDNVFNNVDISDLYNYRWNVSENLDLGEDDISDNICENIKPKTKYDNAYTKNYISVSLFPKTGASALLNNKINYYSTELEKNNASLAYYNRIKQAATVFESFDYDNLVTQAKNLQDFFKIKTELIKVIKDMKDQLSSLGQVIYPKKTGDQVLTEKYNNVMSKIGQIDTLLENCGNLGKSSVALDYVQSQTYDLYNIDIITDTDNSFYVTINNLIVKYNNMVNVIYKTKQEQINRTFGETAAVFKTNIYDALIAFVNDDRWDMLIGSYPTIE